MMKLKNKTNLDTHQLRAFIHAVARREMVDMTRAHITVCYAKLASGMEGQSPENRMRGRAYYGMPPIIRLKFCKTTVQLNKALFAELIVHELAHCQNVHHGKALPRHWSVADANIKHAWVNELPLEYQQPKIKVLPTKEDLITKKMVHALTMGERWETKMRRASSTFKKWKRKATYYDRQLKKAAAAPMNEVTP